MFLQTSSAFSQLTLSPKPKPIIKIEIFQMGRENYLIQVYIVTS